jgi:hypothetical protein
MSKGISVRSSDVLFKYISLPIYNSNVVVMSRGNQKIFTYVFLQKAGCYSGQWTYALTFAFLNTLFAGFVCMKMK